LSSRALSCATSASLSCTRRRASWRIATRRRRSEQGRALVGQLDPLHAPVARLAPAASGTTAERFDGATHGAGIAVSFFLNHTPPGRVAGAHSHPYAEVFAIHSGPATFVVDGREVEAHGGQVVVVAPGATHGFTNSGEGTLAGTEW
jgi:mannose-6-phosphate isomerase-like protein (cupin superfamily)